MPGTKRMSVLVSAWLALATCGMCERAAAQDGVDTTKLPRLAGATEDASDRASYRVPGPFAGTVAAVRAMLAGDGWALYTEPLAEPSRHSHAFKRGAQGLSVFFTTPGGRTDITGVNYSLSRLQNDVPIPDGARDVVFDDRRPYLSANAPGTPETLLDFFRKQLAAAGWSEWSAPDAQWPNAKRDEAVEDGVRAYFTRDRRERREPIQVTLQRRADNRVGIDVRVPAFARPQHLEAGADSFGLPKPDLIKSALSRDGQAIKTIKATIPAELPVVLDFYRRELAKRNWQEQPRGAANPGETVLNYSSASDGTIVLKLGYAYDLTTVDLAQHLTPAVIAAKAKARRDTQAKAMRDFEERMRAPVAKSEVVTNSPLPVPASAIAVSFDATKGELKFDSASGVPEVAGFYRAALKQLGWQERPTPINTASFVALDYARGGKRLHVSILRMGARTTVRAYGPGLLATTVGSDPARPVARPMPTARTADAPAEEPLDAEVYNGFPVPKSGASKRHSSTKFRSELNADVPAALASVLAFYRRALAKQGWNEAANGVVGPDRALIHYAAPDGPAVLTLGRKDGRTTVKLTQRRPAEAQKAGVLPKPGTTRIIMGSFIDKDAVITINKRTIAIGAGVGKDAPNGPALDLPPGRHRYALKIAERPTTSEELTVGADQTWALIVGPGGAIALNIY